MHSGRMYIPPSFSLWSIVVGNEPKLAGSIPAAVATTFSSKMVAISTRNSYKSMENLRTSQGYIFRILQISRPNFGILTLLKGSFREFPFFAWIQGIR